MVKQLSIYIFFFFVTHFSVHARNPHILYLLFLTGVTEEQFKETWTNPGGMNDGGNMMVANPRM